jgi:phage N-6-adenine-methyltransferase
LPLNPIVKTIRGRRKVDLVTTTTTIAEIRRGFETADIIERKNIKQLDRKAQRIRCDSAMRYFANAAAIDAKCKAEGVTLKAKVGRSLRQMQRIRQLWRVWNEYVSKHREYDGDEFGFRLACRLVGIPIDGETGRHDVTGQNGIGPKGDGDEAETPQWLVDLLNPLLRRFTLDAAASATNTKVPENFHDKKKNGLVQTWLPRDRIWLNPPFSNIPPWMKKIIESDAELVLALVPPHFSSAWWRQCVEPYATLIITLPRLKFGDHATTAREDVVLVLFARNASWALDALAPHLANDVSPVHYRGRKRIGALQVVSLLRQPRAIEVTPDEGDTADKDDASMPPAKRYMLSPPSLISLLQRILPSGWWDACPHPLPEGFDSLSLEQWPNILPSYANVPFTRKDELHGRGPSVLVDKCIEQNQVYGLTVAVALPTTDPVNKLFAAGAIAIPLGRLPWLEVETKEPWPSPGASALFILPGKDFIMPKLDQPDSSPVNKVNAANNGDNIISFPRTDTAGDPI